MILKKKHIQAMGASWMPFADAASDSLPLSQLMRLSLFQISVGMAQVLLLGTLNRVMIVELSVPAMIVAAMIGFGGGLFGIATLTAAMTLPGANAGLALGAWGAAQATAAGLAIFLGGTIRDVVGHFAETGGFGPGLTDASLGYSFVYHVEIGLLFVTLLVLGPLVRVRALAPATPASGTGDLRLAEFPT